LTEPEVLHPLRPFLKNWLWEHGRIGTRFLNVRSGELGFDEGKKARFASEPMVYVPLVSHLEDEAPRTAPLVHEAELTQFLRAAQLGKPEEAGTALQVQRAAQDCVELALMCAYQGAAQRAHAKFSQEALFEDEIRAEVVTEVRKLYVGLREQLALYDYTVFHGLPSPLLLGDSPFIDWRVRAKPPMPFVSIRWGRTACWSAPPRTRPAAPVPWPGRAWSRWVRSRTTIGTWSTPLATGWWRPPTNSSPRCNRASRRPRRPSRRPRRPEQGRSVHRRQVIACGLASLGAGICPRLASAQAYPGAPIRFIVPFPAGSGTDVNARLIGERLGQAWASRWWSRTSPAPKARSPRRPQPRPNPMV
jgi:hypothetical protein